MRPSLAVKLARKPGRFPLWLADVKRFICRSNPILELMGKNITLVGNVGDGQTCKVANQIIVALNIEAVAEALLLPVTRCRSRPRTEALMEWFASSRAGSSWRTDD